MPPIAVITIQGDYPDQSIRVWWYAIIPDNPVSHHDKRMGCIQQIGRFQFIAEIH